MGGFDGIRPRRRTVRYNSLRDPADMMSASVGGHGKADTVREVA